MTATGDILGTLRYMSPEQALAKRVVLDHRADIYSLGVTLYEMLTLEPAFRGDDREALLRQIAFEEPRPPYRINKAIPHDLGTIVQKAIRKEPGERYATAQEFADDLKHFLDNEPIQARRPSLLDIFAKWTRRHRTVATAIAAALLIAVVCLAVATAVIGGALQRTRQAERQVSFERDAALDNLYISNVRLAQQEWENGNLTAVGQLLNAHMPTDDRSDLRGWEWNYLKTLCHLDLATLRGHTAAIQTVAWSPDGSRFACGFWSDDHDCVTKVFDRATLAEIYSLETSCRSDARGVRSIAWSPDARYLAAAIFDGTDDGDVIIWEMATGKEVTRLKHDCPPDSVAWSPDGTRIAGSNWRQVVKVWEVGSWRESLNLHGQPDFRGIAAGGEHKVVWAPDGSKLAAGTAWGWLIMWDASTGREVLSFKAHTAQIRSITISPDGLRIATASLDRSVKIWDTAGRQLLTLRGHGEPVNSVAWSPSGEWLKPVSYCENAHEISRALTDPTPMPSFLFEHLALTETCSYRDAEIAPGKERFPVVIFSHVSLTCLSTEQPVFSGGWLLLARSTAYVATESYATTYSRFSTTISEATICGS